MRSIHRSTASNAVHTNTGPHERCAPYEHRSTGTMRPKRTPVRAASMWSIVRTPVHISYAVHTNTGPHQLCGPYEHRSTAAMRSIRTPVHSSDAVHTNTRPQQRCGPYEHWFKERCDAAVNTNLINLITCWRLYQYTLRNEPSLPPSWNLVSCWLIGGSHASLPFHERTADLSPHLDSFCIHNCRSRPQTGSHYIARNRPRR